MSFLLPTLKEHARRAPTAVAIEEGCGGSLDWSTLVDAVESEMANLRALRLAPGRPVALLADRGIALCVLDLALMESGVPVLSLPLFFTAEQRNHALAQSGAQMLVRDSRLEGAAPGDLLREALSFSDVSRSPATPAGAIPAGTARISYTSGSTGTAKGICLSADNLRAVARGVIDAAGAGPGSRHLAVLPPGVLLEEVAGCHAALMSGATYIASPLRHVGLAEPFRPDFARMSAAVEAARATSLILVPEYLAGLAAHLARTHGTLPSLELVAVGGARVAPALLERARAVGLPVRQGYGLTECGSVICLHDGGHEGVGSVGRALASHAVRIAPDGEILVEGPKYLGCVGDGRSIDAGAVFRTGDIGRFDSSGRLWIEGRKSNVIITSFGRNVSPEWIESLLLEQPAIAQAMVLGEGAATLSALIVARGTCTDQDIAAAVAAANAALPEYARVRHWRRAEPFTPANGQLTGNGRLRRAQILAHYPMEEPADAVL